MKPVETYFNMKQYNQKMSKDRTSVYADVMTSWFARKLHELVPLLPADMDAIDATTSRVRRYAARQDLIREGDKPGPIVVILEGWACRYKILPNGTRQIIAFMMPGDACDMHVNILNEMDHGIQAVTPAKVATISRTEMQALMDGHPAIARAMYMAQLVDEGTMRAWIVSIGRRSSIERVAHLVCELYIRMQQIGLVTDASVTLPLSQIMLADALGMTPVHINRVLKELRLSGVVAIGRSKLQVLDPAKLVHASGFDGNYLHRRLHQSVNCSTG